MRNIIMISTDQQKVDAMGCVDPSYYTPNLDKLVDRSIRFTGAISTSAQCSPSRASWMTGKFPHQVGVYQIGHMLDPQEWGIAKEFNRAGYETVYFGKWHLGLSPAHHEFQVTDYRTDGLELAGAQTDPRFHSNKDAVTTAQALNYLEDYDGSKAFFMKMCWYMPHPKTPIDQPFELIDLYADRFPLEDLPIPDSFYQDDLSGKPLFQRERSAKGESHLNTVVLFTSDHGDMQGAHRLRLKGVIPYKELYSVPLILYLPGAKPKRKIIPDLISTSAVTGTLLDAAGIPVPKECEGGSLLPVLERSEPLSDECVFFEHYKAYWGRHPMIGVQTPEWKYVYYLEDDLEEMYSLRNDPDEVTNIAGQPEAEEARIRLRQTVEEWWTASGGFNRPAIEDPESDWLKYVK
ncbi:sulfatase family protein [Paenibacillus chitinolyticus]